MLRSCRLFDDFTLPAPQESNPLNNDWQAVCSLSGNLFSGGFLISSFGVGVGHSGVNQIKKSGTEEVLSHFYDQKISINELFYKIHFNNFRNFSAPIYRGFNN
jgi:hypothetical protein